MSGRHHRPESAASSGSSSGSENDAEELLAEAAQTGKKIQRDNEFALLLYVRLFCRLGLVFLRPRQAYEAVYLLRACRLATANQHKILMVFPGRLLSISCGSVLFPLLGPVGVADLLRRHPKRHELQRRGLRTLRDLAYKGKRTDVHTILQKKALQTRADVDHLLSSLGSTYASHCTTQHIDYRI